jgi:hypothetical protein
MEGVNPVISSGEVTANTFSPADISLDDEYMSDFGGGSGTEAAASPGELDFGEGTAYSLDKIPRDYREKVQRYMELLDSP